LITLAVADLELCDLGNENQSEPELLCD